MHLYIMLVNLHWAYRGNLDFTLQLHDFNSLRSLLITFLLRDFNHVWHVLCARIANLYSVSVENCVSLLDFGKYWSIKFQNRLATLVETFSLKGRLNQMMSREQFCFCFMSFLSVWIKLTFCNHFLLEFFHIHLLTCLFEEFDKQLLIDTGCCFIICGGRLMRCWHIVAGHLASYMVCTFHIIKFVFISFFKFRLRFYCTIIKQSIDCNPLIGKQQWIWFYVGMFVITLLIYLKIAKYMKFKVAKKLLWFFFFTYSILLLCVLIYPSSAPFTIHYKQNILSSLLSLICWALNNCYVNMENNNFNYSLKNILTPTKTSYKLMLMEKIESVIKQMQLKANFYLKKDTSNTAYINFGLKTGNYPPQFKELQKLKKNLLDTIKLIKFRIVTDNFQRKLKEDISNIKSSPDVYTFPRQDYKHLYLTSTGL